MQVSGGFSGIDAAVGGSLSDTLTGDDVASTWTLNGSSKSYDDGAAILSFSAFECFKAGSQNDIFDLVANSTANLNGGDAATRYCSRPTAPSDRRLQRPSGLGRARLRRLRFVGDLAPGRPDRHGPARFCQHREHGRRCRGRHPCGRESSKHLVADRRQAGSVVYGSSSFGFSSVANLIGGGMVDQFLIASGVGVGGAIDGGAGSDLLSFAAFSGGVSVAIRKITQATSPGRGTAFNFAALENIIGGSGNDLFSLANGRSISGVLDGGGTEATPWITRPTRHWSVPI